MGEIDKSLEKDIDDHLKRVYDRYKSNTKIFTATHVGHIAVSVVFLFSILFPFLYLYINSRNTNLKLESLSQRNWEKNINQPRLLEEFQTDSFPISNSR